MITTLIIGSVVVSISIIIASIFMITAIRFLQRIGEWFVPRNTTKSTMALVGVTLWLLGAISVSVWLWAAAFFMLGQFNDLEPALYFSVVTFTTLGFGDVTLTAPWRMLSGLCAANGLLLFGLSTAFLVEFFKQLHNSDRSN
jgi:hypothetical protein